MAKLLSDKVRKLSGSELSSDRYDFLRLAEAEPDFGLPSANNGIMSSFTDGTRDWLYAGAGLDISSNNIIVEVNTAIIDSSNLIFSSANTLYKVIEDLDANLSSAVSGSLTSVTSDSTLSGAGTSGSPLSVVDNGHNHTSSNISDFSESVDDRVNALLQAGTDITLTYNDVANTLTIAANTAAGNINDLDEAIDDRVNALLVAGSNITITYDDAANTLTIASSGTGGFDLSNNTTDDLAEGNTNLYYTEARANTAIDNRVTQAFVDALNVTAAGVQANSVTLGTDTTGDYVASLTAGALIDLQNNTGEGATPTIDVDLSELTDMAANTIAGSDELVILDSGAQGRKRIDSIPVGLFNTANQIALGTDTTGNYVATIAGTANEIEVTGSGSETAAVTIGLPNDVTIGNNLTVTGNLTVSGTTTTVNTTNLDVNDAVITLNTGQATPLNDIGILMQRYATANTTNYNVGIAWEEGSDRLIFGKTPEDGADNDLTFSEEWMTINADGNVGISGDLTLDRSGSTNTTRTLSLGGAQQSDGTDFARLDFINYDANDATPVDYTAARISSQNESGAEYGNLIFSTSLGGSLTERMRIAADGDVTMTGILNLNAYQIHTPARGQFNFTSDGVWNFRSNGNVNGFYLAAEGQNIAALRNGTNAQTFNIYNTYTDGSNYEQGYVKWNSNFLQIGAEGAGTGSDRSVSLMFGAAEKLRTTLNSVSMVDAVPLSSGTYDLGTSSIKWGELHVNNTFVGDSKQTTETATLTTTTQTEVASFVAADFSSGKFVIQATDSVTSEVHVTELLVVHDGTTASATEYGTIHTGASPLATYEVDINTGNVRILATSASTNSTVYKVTENLITA